MRPRPLRSQETPEGRWPKPRTGSLLRSMDLQTVTLEDALRLLSLPRVVGVDPASGEEITAQNGRYGPYLKRGNDSRSLVTEDQIFTITLDEALKIYAEPKRRGRQSASAPRCASWEQIRRRASQWSSRTADSGRTSPTVRPMPACVRATTWLP